MSDDEYQRLLDQLPDKITFALSWSKYIPRLFQAGRRTGLTDMQIRNDAWAKLRGQIGESTFRGLMPPSAKHQEKTREQFALKSSANPKSDIPPPTQVVREAETITQSYAPKQIEPEPEPFKPKSETQTYRIYRTEIVAVKGNMQWNYIDITIDKLNQVITIR